MNMTHKIRKIITMILVLVMMVGIMPTVAMATEGTTYVLAGSDFQPTDYKTATGVSLLNGILSQIQKDYSTMDGFLFAGDYDYGYTASTAGKKALQGAVKTAYPGVTHEIYVEGNHDSSSNQGADLVANGTLSPSGANDSADYGVFVINERDYMWYNNNENTIKNTALRLKLNISYMGLFLYCPYTLGQFIFEAGAFLYQRNKKAPIPEGIGAECARIRKSQIPG